MLYCIECWVVKKQHIHEMNVVEIRMLRWISENKWIDEIWNVLLKDRGDFYWWKYDGELLEIVWSCLDESRVINGCSEIVSWFKSRERKKVKEYKK